VALSGPGVETPRLVRTRLGAAVGPLISGRKDDEAFRVISGSVLNGRAISDDETAYLGRYHNQITVLPEARDRRFLGWLGPGLGRFSVLRLFASKLLPRDRVDITTDRHGGERVMVPLGLYEKVWPFDIPVTPLLRALLAGDMETAEALGCLELSEEDVAVCSFVCSSKIDYGQALRAMLDRIEEEG
jgi:Na+-transporting NADH:ubiquinone oxidoreductase subunit A